MDRSWYQEISVLRLEDDVDDVTNLRRMNDINTFERQLADNGYLILNSSCISARRNSGNAWETSRIPKTPNGASHSRTGNAINSTTATIVCLMKCWNTPTPRTRHGTLWQVQTVCMPNLRFTAR